MIENNLISSLDGYAARGNAAAEKRGIITDEDGVERCAICNEPVFELIGGVKRPVECACDRAEADKSNRRKAVDAARRKAEASPLFCRMYTEGRFSFARDDAASSNASKACRKYVEHFDELKQKGYGLFLSGGVGTGKTFYAACIANKLVSNGVPALMFSSQSLVSAVQSSKSDINELLRELNSFDLLVLDDFGAERETDFALEVIERFTDSRSLSKKPLIVTSNLAPKDMMNACTDLRKMRVCDRLRSMCPVSVPVLGNSRRAEQQREKEQEALRIMGLV